MIKILNWSITGTQHLRIASPFPFQLCEAKSGLGDMSTRAASESASEVQGGCPTVDYDMDSDMGTNTALKQFAMSDDDLYGKVSDLITGALCFDS